jgi:hypothetical protein
MKCGEPKPGATFRDCDEELKHQGDHGYLGERWPRLKPAEPDWDVVELLEDTRPANAWGVAERSFPIIVTETVTRVLWVDAVDEDHAIGYYGDDWSDVPLRESEVLESFLEFERPDKYQREAAFESARAGRKAGPLVPCPDCGVEAFRQEWFHDPYRKCHGPIEWRFVRSGRAFREHKAHAGSAVSA